MAIVEKKAKTARGKIRKGGCNSPSPPERGLRENFCTGAYLVMHAASLFCENNMFAVRARGGGLFLVKG